MGIKSSFQAEQTSGREVDSEHGVTCLAWSECAFESPRIVVGGHMRKPAVWVCDNGGKWHQVSPVPYSPIPHCDAVIRSTLS